MLLFLGASGFLGPAFRAITDTADGIFTHHANAFPGSVHFDARGASVAGLIEQIGCYPTAAFILFGITNVDACARDPVGTAQTNVEAVVRIVDELRALEIVPVFTSSDAVFDGSHGWWAEDEPVEPILTYGRQKLEVERYISSLPKPWLIVRLPKLLSAVRNPRCMLTAWLQALGREDRILCATDQYFTPADAGDVAKGMIELVRSGATGLYHLGGPERLSRRELLEAVLQEYRKFKTLKAEIVECSLRDVPVFEQRPLDTSMDSSRFTQRCGSIIRPASEIARLSVRDHFSNLV